MRRAVLFGAVAACLGACGDGASGPSLPGPAAKLTVSSGDDQAALAGTSLALPVRVKVADAKGKARPGDTVTFAVAKGGGSLTGTLRVVTDASGNAVAPLWTLGKNGGTQQLTATSGLFSTTIDARIQTAYKIDLRYAGTPPAGIIADAFTAAVDRITAMIVGDVVDVPIGSGGTPFQVTQCNSSFTGINGLNETVDDVLIFAKVEPIDGVGQVLGSAGPCLTRTTGGLTALGVMRFDSADLADLASRGRLADVVLHEMLHVVGLGTLWKSRGLLADTGTVNVRVTGALAAASCVNDHGGGAVCTGAVPAENCLDLPSSVTCGVGTINAHWKESTFRTELMTGFAGNSNPLGRMTIQALADLGYGVHTGPADTYTVPSALMASGSQLRAVDDGPPLLLAEPMRPRFSVDARGQVRPIVAPR
ncbi:MAG: leishmanolysin-related zinc metalloendopeptidase [Gemmatimonadota bacterium]